MQQAQESDTESESERARHFGLVVQRGVVEPQLRQRIAKLVVVVRDDGEHAREHARLNLLEARQGFRRLLVLERDGVAHGRAIDFLDAADDEADVAGSELARGHGLRREAAELVDLVRPARRHDANLVADLQCAVEDAHQRDDADIVVEPGVDDERLQRRFGIALGLRNAFDETLDQLFDALARLAGDLERVVGRDADDLLDFLHDARGVGGRQVDLVDDRHHLEPELGGRVAVGDALRLDALRGVDHQQRAVAGGERTRNFVGEVDVAGGVDEVQLVGLAVLLRLVIESDRLRLDGDAAFTLQLE